MIGGKGKERGEDDRGGREGEDERGRGLTRKALHGNIFPSLFFFLYYLDKRCI